MVSWASCSPFANDLGFSGKARLFARSLQWPQTRHSRIYHEKSKLHKFWLSRNTYVEGRKTRMQFAKEANQKDCNVTARSFVTLDTPIKRMVYSDWFQVCKVTLNKKDSCYIFNFSADFFRCMYELQMVIYAFYPSWMTSFESCRPRIFVQA